MPDIQIKKTVSQEDYNRYVNWAKSAYSITQIPDPNFVGDVKKAPLVDKFNSDEWLKEVIMTVIKEKTNQWLQGQAIKNADQV